MLQHPPRGILSAVALFGALWGSSAYADDIKTVFVIGMENHNCTQPAKQFAGGIQQFYQNPAAPFINSLVNGTAFAIIHGSVVHISSQVAYATFLYSFDAIIMGTKPFPRS